MRPVAKKNVGETVTLADGTEHTIKEDYKYHRDSLEPLSVNLGQYCSYCECYSPCCSNLEVEHVQPKGFKNINGEKPYEHLSKKWDNFLLGCSTCNGPGNKSSKDVVLENIHLPHRNNTFLSLEYKEGGVINVNPKLSGKSLENANALVNLLNLSPTEYKDIAKDYRIEMRRRAWEKADEYLNDYRNGETTIEKLIDYIKVTGCWSVWFTVFKDCPEVRKELIEHFPGTAQECFDPGNGYDPVPRNPDNASDPV